MLALTRAPEKMLSRKAKRDVAKNGHQGNRTSQIQAIERDRGAGKRLRCLKERD